MGIINPPIFDKSILEPMLADRACSLRTQRLTASGWGLLLQANQRGEIVIPQNSHFPVYRSEITGLSVWQSGIADVNTNRGRIFALNTATTSLHWMGSSYSHVNSEQIIDIVKDNNNKILGIYITEKGNEHSINILNENNKPLQLIEEILTYETHPKYFNEDKECIFTINEILKELKEEL